MLFFKDQYGFGAGPQQMFIDTSAIVAPPQPGECTSDGQMIWRAATSTVPAHWERLRVGETCSTVGQNQVTVNVHAEDASVCPPGMMCLPPGQYGAPDSAPYPTIEVGPFRIPAHVDKFAIHWSGLLPDDWRAFINAELAHDCSGCVSSSMRDATPGHPYGALRDFLGPEMPTQINQDFAVRSPYGFGNAYAINVNVQDPSKSTVLRWEAYDQDLSDFVPIVATTHPVTGEDFGIYMWMAPRDTSRAWDSTTNPYELNLIWHKIDRHWYAQVWDFIKHIISKLEDAFCSIMHTPGVPQSLGKAGPYGAATVVLATQMCSPASISNCPTGLVFDAKSNQCIPPTPVPPVSPWWQQWYVIVPVVLGLGYAVLKIFETKPKAATP